MRFRFVAAALGALILPMTGLHAEGNTAGQPQAADKETQCVMLRTINGWSRIDDRTLLLRSTGRRYKVTFDTPCYEANWAFSARVDHEGVCLHPGDMMIFEIDAAPMAPSWHHRQRRGFEERCLIKSIERVPTP